MLGNIISILVVGLIIGALGRLFAPGRQNISILMTMGVGVVAALIGTLISMPFGWDETRGVDWIEHIIQIALAAVGVSWAANRFARR